jgi:hypothetical protein
VAYENLVLVAVWEEDLSQDQMQGAGVVCYRKKNHVLVSLFFSCEYNLKVKLALHLLWKVTVSFIFVYFFEKNGCMFIWQPPYINYGFQSLMPLIHSQRVQRPKAAIQAAIGQQPC